ncbi:MAG: hypothetical protein KGO96_06790 [Elusimicrobia bacterium]|nr:hypothetical protein [Elusimicrobiota bacterium]
MRKKNRTSEEEEILVLKKENNKLKRAVSTLRKKLERYETVPIDFYDLDSQPEEKGVGNCPACKSPDVIELLLGDNKLFKICRNCRWRRHVPTTEQTKPRTGSKR